MCKRNPFAWALGLIGCFTACLGVRAAFPQTISETARQDSAIQHSSNDGDAGHGAVWPIVYQIDDGVPSPRGFRYLFYGNGFFINRDGYLLTAAHVLSQLHGGQPYLLLRDSADQPRFVQADVIVIDHRHDIAVLRATPNPFDASGTVAFLPLASKPPAAGEMVQAADLRPSSPRDAYSLDPVLEEHAPGAVLRFEFSKLDDGAADTELFLFNHAIHPGQSGSPVISDVSQGVAGLVEGQWLRGVPGIASLKSDPASGEAEAPAQDEVAPIPGAAIPIHYAIALLQQKGIAWQAAPENGSTTEPAALINTATPTLAPMSLVPAPYPSQALFGGEVVLDALISPSGTVSDVKVVHGDEPFLAKALDAVQTWTFFPASAGERAAEQRLAITFQFPQPYVPPRAPTVHHYEADLASFKAQDAAEDGAALPTTTVEPEYPVASNAEGSVILYESIDREGNVASVQSVSGAGPFTAAVAAASREWQFAPAMQSGAAVNSAAIVVVTFRRPLATSRRPH
jgi:TonB family protein